MLQLYNWWKFRCEHASVTKTCWWDKGVGHYGHSTGKWEQRKRPSRFKGGFWGFIYPPLIKQLWQRPGSDKGRGQVWFSDQLLAWQTIAASLKAARCLSASRTSQHGAGADTVELLIEWELGSWLRRIVTYNRVMSLMLIYIDQENCSDYWISNWIWITNVFPRQDVSISILNVSVKKNKKKNNDNNQQPPATSWLWK